jgi:hypothetical protein
MQLRTLVKGLKAIPKRRKPKRFLEENRQALVQEFLTHFLFIVTVGHVDPNLRVNASQFAKGLFSIHVGHGESIRTQKSPPMRRALVEFFDG